MKIKNPFILTLGAALMLASCGQQNQSSNGALSSSAAEKVYVAPGEQDEYYAFLSGGYSGNLTVYGLPSGRMFKEIPVFSQSLSFLLSKIHSTWSISDVTDFFLAPKTKNIRSLNDL